MEYDVAIIGGGPGGSTTGGMLRKFDSNIRVGIFEREVFPRDHIGESLLPTTCVVLNELGAWDKVEAADFPIKIGGIYRWGKSKELWDFDFLAEELFKEEPRPGTYEGQRRSVAFQVDRALYDQILLNHARDYGCEVHEGCKVSRVNRDGDRVTGLELETGETVTARHYVDASGNSAVLRRAMGVKTDEVPSLQNAAFWAYWQHADWGVTIGIGGTRIHIWSLDYGWIWFIPLGATRTGIGRVTPVSYFKSCGLRPEELYRKALGEESIVAGLLENATCESKFATTKDWSFVSERQTGENWFLVGESGGFADPILSAGLSITHSAGREAAFTILELDRGKHDAQWLKEQFARRQSSRLRNHIRFADYWYSANTQFKDLQEFTAQIASENGLDLSPQNAWRWIAAGGFIDEDVAIGTGTVSLQQIKVMGRFLNDLEADSPLEKNNVFKLDLSGATWMDRARYADGKVFRDQCYVRGDRVLPIAAVIELLVNILQRTSTLDGIMGSLEAIYRARSNDFEFIAGTLRFAIEGLEAMISDGWVKASYDPSRPLAQLGTKNGQAVEFRWHEEVKRAVAEKAKR